MIDFNTAIKEDHEGAYKTMKEFTGDNMLLAKKELYYLRYKLMEHEQVLVFCSGFMDGNNGLVVLTDKRIMFIFKGILSEKLTSIPLMKITSLSGEQGVVHGKIVINDGSSSIKISHVQKKAVSYLIKKYQELAYKG